MPWTSRRSSLPKASSSTIPVFHLSIVPFQIILVFYFRFLGRGLIAFHGLRLRGADLSAPGQLDVASQSLACRAHMVE